MLIKTNPLWLAIVRLLRRVWLDMLERPTKWPPNLSRQACGGWVEDISMVARNNQIPQVLKVGLEQNS